MSDLGPPAPELPLAEFLAAYPVVPEHRPWARHLLDRAGWEALARWLASGTVELFALWGEPTAVHAALFEPATEVLAVASLPCPEGRFPALGRLHPPAIRLERTIRDLRARTRGARGPARLARPRSLAGAPTAGR